ncbi:hypothetical protein B484DRAFT_263253 [Ochromonadaceae sp. CCMP2298]|nr:hypothetical protein B484DRAFT_263253 [Ochromonadaceae sp. CCMP2298]
MAMGAGGGLAAGLAAARAKRAKDKVEEDARSDMNPLSGDMKGGNMGLGSPGGKEEHGNLSLEIGNMKGKGSPGGKGIKGSEKGVLSLSLENVGKLGSVGIGGGGMRGDRSPGPNVPYRGSFTLSRISTPIPSPKRSTTSTASVPAVTAAALASAPVATPATSTSAPAAPTPAPTSPCPASPTKPALSLDLGGPSRELGNIVIGGSGEMRARLEVRQLPVTPKKCITGQSVEIDDVEI